MRPVRRRRCTCVPARARKKSLSDFLFRCVNQMLKYAIFACYRKHLYAISACLYDDIMCSFERTIHINKMPRSSLTEALLALPYSLKPLVGTMFTFTTLIIRYFFGTMGFSGGCWVLLRITDHHHFVDERYASNS